MGYRGQAALGESLRKVEAELAAGRGEQALALCQEAQARFPRALAVQRTLGEVYLTLRKPREALGALERALAGDPEDARALCARAIIHQMHGDSAAALAWYRRACDVRPDDPVLRASYRELAAHMGQPPYAPTRLGLARLYLRGDLLTHAVREWETLAAERPEQLDAQVGLAEALWRTGQARAAEEQCRHILANAPFCVKAHVLLAALLLDRKLPDDARRHAARAAELDPEQRIAQALFADRLAAGDAALATLFLGSPSASRPLTATPRAALPVGSQHLLSETEYMLWGPDEETRARAAVAARQATAAHLPAVDPAQAAKLDHIASDAADAATARQDQVVAPRPRTTGQLGHATQFVPPALVGQGESMSDTEKRKAIGWVQWLQSQGARVHPGAGATGASAAPQPASPRASSPANRPPRATGPLGGAPAGASPEPADNTSALRAMFAELDGGARSAVGQSAAGPTPGPTAGPRADMPGGSGAGREPLYPPDPRPAGAASPRRDRGGDPYARSGVSGPDRIPPTAPRAWDDGAGRPAGWLAEDAAQPNLLPRDRRETETERLAHAHALRQSESAELPATAVTLEALERRFAESGFQPVEPQPGLLAAMAAGDSGVISSLTSSLTSSRVPSFGPERVELPTALAGDYVGRMHLARAWRKEGRLDDALAEYRVLLKQAPDLLPELIEELRECQRQAPEHPEAHRLLGDARIQQGDYLGALEAYNRAVALTHPDEL